MQRGLMLNIFLLQRVNSPSSSSTLVSIRLDQLPLSLRSNAEMITVAYHFLVFIFFRIRRETFHMSLIESVKL
jgi:hypothetical protein